MTKEKIFSYIRHTLTFAAGFLVTKGYLDASVVEPVISAVLTLGTLIWSNVEKTQIDKKLKGS